MHNIYPDGQPSDELRTKMDLLTDALDRQLITNQLKRGHRFTLPFCIESSCNSSMTAQVVDMQLCKDRCHHMVLLFCLCNEGHFQPSILMIGAELYGAIKAENN